MGSNDNLENLLRSGDLKAEPPSRRTARHAKDYCARPSTAPVQLLLGSVLEVGKAACMAGRLVVLRIRLSQAGLLAKPGNP